MTRACSTRDAARSAAMAIAASRERPPRTVKAADLSYYGIGDRTIRAHVLGLLDLTPDLRRRQLGISDEAYSIAAGLKPHPDELRMIP